MNFCYLFVTKLQVKCSLSYYIIVIIYVLSQFQQFVHSRLYTTICIKMFCKVFEKVFKYPYLSKYCVCIVLHIVFKYLTTLFIALYTDMCTDEQIQIITICLAVLQLTSFISCQVLLICVIAINLLHRLAVKTLVDKSSLGIIDDGTAELDNFITILEHIFNHRLKRKTSVKTLFKIVSLSEPLFIFVTLLKCICCLHFLYSISCSAECQLLLQRGR